MKVLMVSWEYPPVVVGGLGRHVYQLATALAADGHEVVVLSRRPTGTDPSTHPSTDEDAEGVRVVAAAQDPHEFDFSTDMMAWTLAMGHSMVRAGLGLKTRGRRSTQPWRPDVVHAHDWLVAHPAIALAEHFDVPLVSTIHATEAGRHSGWVAGRISRQVHAVEGWLVRESDSLITCSASMADEITELFGPGLAETRVIRNGIDAALWPFAKRRPHPDPRRLLYLGRLEYEKGVHELIAALPRIRRRHPGTTLTIAGDGTQQDWLVQQARKHKVLKAVDFVGRVDHEQLVTLLHRHRRRGAAQPLRAVRHRRTRGRGDRRTTRHVQRRRPRRGRPRRRDRRVVPAARRVGADLRGVRRARRPRRCATPRGRREETTHVGLRLAHRGFARPRRSTWPPSAANANPSGGAIIVEHALPDR